MTQQSHYWAYTPRKPQFKKTHGTPMFTAALFTIARTWKQLKHPSQTNGYRTCGTGEFPSSPVVGFHDSTVTGMGSIPAQGTKIPHSLWCGQGKKRRRCGIYIQWNTTQP